MIVKSERVLVELLEINIILSVLKTKQISLSVFWMIDLSGEYTSGSSIVT